MMSEGSNTRRDLVFRVLLALAVTTGAGIQLIVWLTADAQTLVQSGLVKDDAFFYSVLVDNFRAHGFFTLDGTMPTNGFQPLWMWTLLLLKSLLPQVDTFMLLRAMSWTSYLLFCAGATWLVSHGE